MTTYGSLLAGVFDKKNMKIVFFGTPEFAVESLAALVDNGFDVAGVVTMPDKPAGRGHKLLQSAVKQYALEKGLRLMQPVNLKDPSFVEELRSLGADLFIVIAFRMLPEVVWAMPPMGTFNLHASLLPRYRGAAPINRAVMNGDTVTGVTTFMLRHEIDTGDILQQVAVEILPEENVGDVHDKLMHLGAELTVETVRRLVAGDLKPIPQDELIGDTEPTPAPKIFTEDCVIDWRWSAEKIHNHVRGLSPYPAARSLFVSSTDSAPELMKIFETRVCDFPAKTEKPGQVAVVDGKRMIVATGEGGAVEVLSLQSAGKKRMETEAYMRGARLNSPFFEPF